MTIIENVPVEKKKLKAFLDFSVPIKSTSTTEGGEKGKKIPACGPTPPHMVLSRACPCFWAECL